MKTNFIIVAGVVISLALLAGMGSCCKKAEANSVKEYDRATVVSSPDSALKILLDGNKRFITDSVLTDNTGMGKRKLLSEKGQKPFAVIIACSDSRVAPEIIFDQGLGDLFVIRVAGNVLDSVILGSVEYAVEHLGSPLVVLLGHEKCGAVTAVLEGGEVPGNIVSISDRIEPCIDSVKIKSSAEPTIDLVIDENIKENVVLLENDTILEEFIKSGKVKIIGAKYHIETGEVEVIE